MTVDRFGLLSERLGTLTERVEYVHSLVMEKLPTVDRIACALYDSKTDLLKTFINSTREGEALKAYEIKLGDVPSLIALAETGECRVIDDIDLELTGDSTHTQWVRSKGYKSSFTVTLNNGSQLIGFLFFDSSQQGTFTPEVQRDLLIYSNLIQMAVASELMVIDSLLATTAAARDFADLRDFETGKHLDRMAQFSRLIAREIAEQLDLSDEFVEQLYLFAPLHDIGKIGIPDQILLKPGRLTPEERTVVQEHVAKGVSIIEKVLSEYSLNAVSDTQVLMNIISCHHEYLDGSGYPKGKSGDEIPIEARVITVADIFDALTSIRPYKKPWDVDDAIDELRRMASESKLDSRVVEALAKHRDEAARLVVELADLPEDISA
jgi:HD-GYP domain-containing protein (c-di-GMP phosphodiesterase class II)